MLRFAHASSRLPSPHTENVRAHNLLSPALASHGNRQERKVDKYARKVNIMRSGKDGARPVHQIIFVIKWIRASRLSIKNSVSPQDEVVLRVPHACSRLRSPHTENVRAHNFWRKGSAWAHIDIGCE